MNELEQVRAKLRETKGQWLRIARESNVSHRAIYNVVYGKVDPRVSTVENLAKWFRENEPAKADA